MQISQPKGISNFFKMMLDHPKGLYFLFCVEMWERFSYYGIRALLFLYMTEKLIFSVGKAGSIYAWYTGLIYTTPLIGGYIADRYLGARRSILIGGGLMALGQFCLATGSLNLFFAALGLLVLGNGFFKPNISTIVGKLYPENDHRRDGGFTIFYMGINLGAFLAPLVCGTLAKLYGYKYGFMFAGFGMILGLIIYILGQNKFLAHYGLAPIHCKEQKECPADATDLDKPLTKEDKQKIAVIFTLVFFSIFFWSSFEQAGSSLTLFAEHSTNRMLPILHKNIPASFFQSINPFLIMILAPLFSSLWLGLSNKKLDPSAPMKFVLSLSFVSLGFIVMFFAANLAGLSGKVSFLWLISVYFLHTIGELCLSPVGLSMITKLAPLRFASMLMGVWLSGSSLANLTAGFFAGNYDKISHNFFFLIPAVTSGIAAVILLALVPVLKKWMNGVE
ncbi:MAG: peptide MFS transporter [bacterium]